MVAVRPRITAFLVKVASRCNIACDYCYVYTHADQSWRERPPFLSSELRRALAYRIGEYVHDERIDRATVIFHGGEPLLAGAETLAETAQWVRDAAEGARIDVGLQTNGLLLDDLSVKVLANADIAVSLSLDGPRVVNDLHRIDHAGASTFTRTEQALRLLEDHRDTYAGVIAVIDPTVAPRTLLEFFAPRIPPRLDFLLPDANHDRPPIGRDGRPTLYRDWLIEAFDVWFDEFPHIPVRLFDSILAGLAGGDSGTDAFGLGDVSLLTIETDGSYHDLDVLKITRAGQSALGFNVVEHSIAEASDAPQIRMHRQLLKLEGLSATCRACTEVAVCGGGSVPHRFCDGSFDYPTVYCGEMLALIRHARARLQEEIQRPSALSSAAQTLSEEALRNFEAPETSATLLSDLQRSWRDAAVVEFQAAVHAAVSTEPSLSDVASEVSALGGVVVGRLATLPSVVAWTNVMRAAARGEVIQAINGNALQPEPAYLKDILARASNLATIRIHAADRWLRAPFGDKILFESEEIAKRGTGIVESAFGLIEEWRPAVLDEIYELSPELQFITDPTAHPDKAVSFSDNSVPGALYATLRLRGQFVDPHDLADAIIHEHRHQKLYLLQRRAALFTHDWPLVSSPWREDPRPPSGLLHAVFVFVHIISFWNEAAMSGGPHIRARAVAEVTINTDRLRRAFAILDGSALTTEGSRLLSVLRATFDQFAAVEHGDPVPSR